MHARRVELAIMRTGSSDSGASAHDRTVDERDARAALVVGRRAREVTPDHKLRAEPDGLVERSLGQVVARDAVGKSGVVLDSRAGTGLASRCVVLDDDSVEALGRRVYG